MAAPSCILFEEIVQGRNASVKVAEVVPVMGKEDDTADKQDAENSLSDKMGYVYAAWNPCFEDLIKIGATTKDNPHERILQLSGTNVPKHFELIASVPCAKPFKLEKEIHLHFNATRMIKRGAPTEFFKIDKKTVTDYFNSLTTTSLIDAGMCGKGPMAAEEGVVRNKMKEDKTSVESIPFTSIIQNWLEGGSHKRKLNQVELEERMLELEIKRANVQKMQLAQAEKKQIQLADEEIARANVQMQLAEAAKIRAETLTKLCNLYTSLCTDQIIDERGRILIKDCVLNSAVNCNVSQITSSFHNNLHNGNEATGSYLIIDDTEFLSDES